MNRDKKVSVYGNLKEKDLDDWRSGVFFNNNKINPCEIRLVKKDLRSFILKITLREDRNRQIRRISSLFGYEVFDLGRVNFANISLGNLKEGEWRIINNFKFQNTK